MITTVDPPGNLGRVAFFYMSYLHCHNCKWSQDDFWKFKINWKNIFKWKYRPFGYNPFSLILEAIAEYWRPRFIKCDKWFAKENNFKSNRIHSWFLARFEIKNSIKSLFTQKYWTYKSYEKALKDKSLCCPICKKQEYLDID